MRQPASTPLLYPLVKVTKVEFVNGFQLWLAFSDGSSGVVDLGPLLQQRAFREVRQPDMFQQAFLDEQLGTVAWPSGQDMNPKSLRALIDS